jgi:hypothetical protein
MGNYYEEGNRSEEQSSNGLWVAAGRFLALGMAVVMVAVMAIPVVTSIFSSPNQTEAYLVNTRTSSLAVQESAQVIMGIASRFRGTRAEMIRLSEATNRIVTAAEDLREMRPPEPYTFGHQALVGAADQYALAARLLEGLLLRSNSDPVSEQEAIVAITEFQLAHRLMQEATEEFRRNEETLRLNAS